MLMLTRRSSCSVRHWMGQFSTKIVKHYYFCYYYNLRNLLQAVQAVVQRERMWIGGFGESDALLCWTLPHSTLPTDSLLMLFGVRRRSCKHSRNSSMSSPVCSIRGNIG